ncbi:MAG: hypothetical protein GXP49_13570 [Deltaproteobacteria bacterium]|nr:hypothetical protein [Deltaproteobacteria bacterium]
MEREELLCLLSTALFGMAVWVAALALDKFPSRPVISERRAWWALVAPLFVGLMTTAFLAGWALQEPDPTDEWASGLTWAIAGWMSAGLIRALWRSWLAARTPRLENTPVATLGLFRHRIVVSPVFVEAAGPAVLAAALSHELAHKQAHDPVRIWLAQFFADLQWPVPGTAKRLRTWLLALEMRRDDEAVANGAGPMTLAEAIILAARLGNNFSIPRARAAGSSREISARVQRLIEAKDPVLHRDRARASHLTAPGALVICLGTSLWLGFIYGERLLAFFPGIIR